jgi:D-alanyl-D-alanine dipeptidase
MATNTLITYRDLLGVNVRECNEELVSLTDYNLMCSYKSRMRDMQLYLGNKVLVRRSVANMLQKAQKNLVSIHSRYLLNVTYGFRSVEIQTKLFKGMVSHVAQDIYYENPVELYEKVHEYIAVPVVSGHPTGGAVDITIFDSVCGADIDMGSKMYVFDDRCKTFDQSIGEIGKSNRKLLRSLMLDVGFAPYDGEYWHFSYGDREWAKYYAKNNALYEQISISQAIKLLR